METRRDLYGLNLEGMSDEQLTQYIERLEEDLVRTETLLEVTWEEVNRRNAN